MVKRIQRMVKVLVLVSLSIIGLSFYLDTPLARGDDTVTVNVQAIPAPTVTEFPPNNTPADLDPKEAADTKANVKVEGGAFNGSFDGTKLTITSVGEVTVSGTTKIRRPNNADQTLKDHENGHDDLIKGEYNRTAKKKAEDAMRGFKGMMFVGEGNTRDERKASATAKAEAERNARLKKAEKGIFDQIDTLNKKYDDLTKHGTSQTVNTSQGKQMAKKELGLASAAGSNPFIPDSNSALAGTADPPRVTFDPDTGLLTFDFSGSPLDFSSAGPGDPILGSIISLSPLQLIGPQENGTIHLATSELNVSKDGSDVLHGYLVEAAYMPSTLPGFAGMIQGYLDVPPAFTGAGINNTIGSGFLSDYQAQFDDEVSAKRSTLWFYTDQMLFDNSGNILSLSSEGTFKFGIAAVPEPSSLVLMVSGALAFVGYLLYRHRRVAGEKRQHTPDVHYGDGA